ncbi:tripartite tricarboxylate transporter TctB family protein [Rhizobium terrae]|uniref:tripartite tricarboxylate transporter TctB family protein n=1 Tax=Rhizobium terrae TaxID=2171756 RepID=UPI000E3D74E2|nr:tripartite tricarboxylate transporter TctB family protein [Rhizobium terrae]
MKPSKAPSGKLGQDIVLGLVFVVAGVTAGAIAMHYPLGTSGRMGPGYFPIIISTLLAGVGIILLLRFRYDTSEPIRSLPWKQLILVPGAIVLFGLLAEQLGLVLDVLLLTIGCAAASHKFQLTWKALAGAVLFSVFCAFVFVELLGLPFPVFGSWLQGIGGF